MTPSLLFQSPGFSPTVKWVQEIQYQVLVYLKLRKWGGDIDGSHKQHGSMEKVSILKTVSSGAVAVMATINRQFSLEQIWPRKLSRRRIISDATAEHPFSWWQ